MKNFSSDVLGSIYWHLKFNKVSMALSLWIWICCFKLHRTVLLWLANTFLLFKLYKPFLLKRPQTHYKESLKHWVLTGSLYPFNWKYSVITTKPQHLLILLNTGQTAEKGWELHVLHLLIYLDYLLIWLILVCLIHTNFRDRCSS